MYVQPQTDRSRALAPSKRFLWTKSKWKLAKKSQEYPFSNLKRLSSWTWTQPLLWASHQSNWMETNTPEHQAVGAYFVRCHLLMSDRKSPRIRYHMTIQQVCGFPEWPCMEKSVCHPSIMVTVSSKATSWCTIKSKSMRQAGLAPFICDLSCCCSCAVSLFSKHNMLFRSSCPGQKGLPGGTPTEQETPMTPASMTVPSREGECHGTFNRVFQRFWKRSLWGPSLPGILVEVQKVAHWERKESGEQGKVASGVLRRVLQLQGRIPEALSPGRTCSWDFTSQDELPPGIRKGEQWGVNGTTFSLS